jgi:hypothetical protein
LIFTDLTGIPTVRINGQDVSHAAKHGVVYDPAQTFELVNRQGQVYDMTAEIQADVKSEQDAGHNPSRLYIRVTGGKVYWNLGSMDHFTSRGGCNDHFRTF